ncbi:hypothetical protein [Emticicia sp. BO119]|uniref:hypothetical protein n=1 Tax=Emticicia sp. BO119 TaxID=2757768 RepID=UPI0015F05608|nr:hypothetical protein [Emticicia sp. BO119]MBA4851478.1 hypothetical protein [Emticicia sp. BO119]
MSVVLGKVSISLLLSLFTIILLYKKEKINGFLSVNSHLAIIGAWFGLRLLPFCMVYVFLNFSVKSDVIFFYDTARQALKGMVVYRDFWQPYSPLFPYLNAVTLAIVDSPKSIIFLMMIYELIAIYLTKAMFSNKYTVFYIVLYLALPAPFIFLLFGGQEDIFLWLFIAWGIWYYKKSGNAIHIGFILGLGILCTKILLIIPIALLLIFSRLRGKILTGLLIVGIPSVAIMLYLVGEKILAPLQLGDLPFAPNLVSILSPVIGGVQPQSKLLNWGGLLIILAGAFYYLKNLKPYSETRLLVFAFILTNMITIIVHKNSLPNYLYTILLPVIYFFGESFKTRQWVLMILLNIIGAVHPSLWYYLGGKYYDSFIGWNMLNVLEYLLQIVYLGLCIYFVYFLSQLSSGKIKTPSIGE